MGAASNNSPEGGVYFVGTQEEFEEYQRNKVIEAGEVNEAGFALRVARALLGRTSSE
jgi:hypothetical protein